MRQTPAHKKQSPVATVVVWLSRFERLVEHTPLWLIVWVISAFWHALLMVHASPNVFPDSGSYTLLAEAIRDGRWHSGFTFRTPGYPAFLYTVFSLGGWKNFAAVMFVQVLLGTTVPVLLYLVFVRVATSKWVAVCAALSYLLDRFSLGLETVPLTEFLSGYTILSALVIFVVGLQSSQIWTAPAAGAVAAINFLIRPSFQYLYVFWVLLALVLCWRSPEWSNRRRFLVQWLAIYLVVLGVAILGWSLMVWRHTGVFAPSLQLGASMTNHTGSFMELAPDEYAVIRDMYVQEREKRAGNHINLFDEAGWKIAEATSCTLWQLSLKFKEINSYLIWHYPGRYLTQVAKAWDRIWTEDSRYITDFTDPYATGRPAELTQLFRFLAQNPVTRLVYWPIEASVWENPKLLRTVPWLLLVGAGWVIVMLRRSLWAKLVVACIISTIFYHMAVHVLVQFTEFGRYKLPVQGLWFSFAVFLAGHFVDTMAKRLAVRDTSQKSAK